MSRITAKTVSGVAADVLRMTLPQQEDLLDRIHESQPHILLTILALSEDGVPISLVEHALHVLMVTHIVLTDDCAVELPVVSHEDVLRAVDNHVAMLSDSEIDPGQERWASLANDCSDSAMLAHLLAYFLAYFEVKGITLANEAECMIALLSKVTIDLYVGAYQNRS